MKFYLIVAKGPKQGFPIPINIDLFLLGSEKLCQLRAPSLAPRHCAFVTREKKVFVRDFGSDQPTLVNGQNVPTGEEWPLHAGDRIEVGPLEFMIQFREKALSQRDLEEWASSCLDVQADRDILAEPEPVAAADTASQAAAQIIDKLNAMKGLVKGRLRIGREQGIVSVRLNDTMLVEDSEINHVKRELCDNLNKPNLRVLLDLKNVRRMSSNAVTMLTEFHSWLKPWGSTLAICRIREELRGVLGSLHVSSIPIFPDKKAAYAAKW